MKKSLIEELKRIHTLTYGKQVISEETLLDKILGRTGDKDKEETKVDDPKKADLVSSDVQQFFDTLKKAADGGGISQQEMGSMNFQKEVESMQIGLTMLGYELPKYGVDGLYGPETAIAVEKFKSENNVKDGETTNKEKLNESMTQLKTISYPNLKFDSDGTQNDFVNQGLLDDLNKAANAAGLVATITTAKTGHGFLTKSGVKSRHMDGTGVDIAILDGVGAGGASSSTNGNAKFRELGNRLASALESMGYKRNVERGNDKAVLWQTNTGGNHFNHLHVSNKVGASELPASVSGSGSDGVSSSKATTEMLNKLIELLKIKGVTSEDLKKYIDKVTTGGGGSFTDIDLTTSEGFELYGKICQNFIETRKPNPLGITGKMLADGAKKAFEGTGRYVPPELALAQLVAEGGIGNSDLNSRPIKTKNPYNVGNVDSGANIYYSDVQNSINTYYSLIARNYLGKGKTANDLIQNFVNKNGNRYASAQNYETVLNSLINSINRSSQSIVASSNQNKTNQI
jgi:hypothetical protein